MKKKSISIVLYIVSIFGETFGKYIGIFFISMLPVIELRGSIPVGFLMNLPWLPNMIVSIIGNMIPVPFILVFVNKILQYLKNKKIFLKFIDKLENKAKKKSDKILKNTFIGLFIFVAIPFPGTGAWTGALIAAMFNLNKFNSYIAIFVGVVVAAIAMTIMTYGVSSIIS